MPLSHNLLEAVSKIVRHRLDKLHITAPVYLIESSSPRVLCQYEIGSDDPEELKIGDAIVVDVLCAVVGHRWVVKRNLHVATAHSPIDDVSSSEGGRK